ncbi:hypothetical protein GJ496_008260 [Pomphorhynchus laevis]|nr:hypothetical protein GJ496_008260 [Pomphorhynchus laevis]
MQKERETEISDDEAEPGEAEKEEDKSNVDEQAETQVQLQRVCFALPLILSSPLTLIILIDWTFNCQKKLVVVSDYIHLETVCYKDINKWFLIQFCASWICQIALTIHIWFPNNRKLEKTQRLFAQSISQMGLVDQRLLFTRYADKFNNDEMTYENRKQRCNKDDRQKPHTQRRKSVKAIKTINKPPFIFMCATMWHETEMEMTKLIKSLLRIDQYKQKSESRRRHKRNIDLFEFEVHIWFDDAFMDIAQGHVPNTFVKLLVSLMKSVGRVLYGEEYCIDDPVKIPTPYGGRLIWTLPGKTKVVVHLKDKLLCRHKKRWSQVMYMYYLLTYLMIDQLPDQQGIYQAGSYPGRKSLKTELYEKMQNTYILALDGDVDFQPKSIVVLLDRMRKNLSVGAACGRIHPTGKGPLIWYQRFEYAVGHWLQKAAEHKLGCVLCSPGCFSLFRGSALIDDNVLARYSTRSSEAQHYIQYDQGEDRWLCTLLLQQGYRVEYCAFSNALTHAPESFAEFFNQRRRWMPSTMANILDLLKESNRTIRLNASINSFYIVYQGFLFASTLLGPATIILTIASAFRTIFSWLTLTESYLLACFPALFYMIICFTCKSNTQIKLAALLSSFYAAIMATVLVATTAQIVKSNYLTASSLFLPFIAVIYMITGFLHPDEYSNLIHGILYLLALPSGYLLLVIYSFCSLHIVQWGTRENLHKFESADQPKQSLINMLKNYIYQIQNRYCSSIEGDSGNARPKKDCGHQCNRNLNMCQNCTSSLKNAAGCLSIMADQKSKDFKIDRSLTQSKVISTSAVMHSSSPSDISVPSSANLSKQCDNLNNSSFENTSTLSRKSICSNNTLQVAQSRSVNQLAIVANNIIVPRNYLFNPYWLECDHLLGYGGSNHLNANELYFWQQLIDRYLYPIQLNVEQQINITSQLVTMRNNCCFVVFMVNALWVVIQHQFEYVAMDLDELLLDVGILIGQPPGKHKVQPLGLIYMVCFIITLLLQFYGMLLHRWSTLIEVLANTKLSLFHRYVGKTQPKRAKQDLRKKSTLSTKNLSVGHKVSTANAVSANLLRKRRKNKPRHSTSGTDNEIKDYYESDHFSGSDDQFSYNSYSDSAGYVSTDSSEIVYE